MIQLTPNPLTVYIRYIFELYRDNFISEGYIIFDATCKAFNLSQEQLKQLIKDYKNQQPP